MHAESLLHAKRSGTPVDSAARMALAAVIRLYIEQNNGRSVSRDKLKNLRRACRDIAPEARPLRGEKERSVADLKGWIRNT